MSDFSVAIVGAGIGGVAAALALNQRGIDSRIYEQAPAFGRIGAAINLTPNAVQILEGLDVGHEVRAVARQPRERINRDLMTGEVRSRLPLAKAAEQRFGAPLLSLHRADLLDVLERQLLPGQVAFGKELQRVRASDDIVHMAFADGDHAEADVLLACDGIHSVTRSCLFPEALAPSYTGIVAFRSLFPVDREMAFDTDSFTKWWGPNREMEVVTFPSSRGEMFVFATLARPEWTHESWTFEGDPVELHAGFANAHPEAQNVLEHCTTVLKTALFDREPLSRWVRGRVALLGDACHPMTPFMAQGAAMALEDAAVVARCLEDAADPLTALRVFERTRASRASRIQTNSHNNAWQGSQLDADWVYGYDAWRVPLAV